MGIPLTLSQVPLETPYTQYVASNGQTVFPYPFAITQDSDLIVVVNGVTLNTDAGYSLSGQGNPTGGNLTFTSGQTAGTIVTLFRDIPIERISQISQNSGFSSTVFNAEFNNIYLIMQQLESSIGLCLQIPNTNNPTPATILTPAVYAGKYLSFDSNGNPTPALLTSSGSITTALIVSLLSASVLGGILVPQVAAETTVFAASGGSIANIWYPVGHVYRYGTNSTPGTTDMAPTITVAANVCRQGGYTLQIPMSDILLVNSSLNFSGIRVQGLGCSYNTPSNFPTGPGSGFIQANKTIQAATPFDVITSTGLTIIDGIGVDGGWDGTTYGGALSAGNILALTAVSPAHPYVNTISNCGFSNARRSLVYIARGGYTVLHHMHCLGAGFNGLECTGVANTDPCTSIRDYGGSQYGSTPYGYGLSLTNCVNMEFDGTILEATNGIQLNGTGNRGLSFRGVYQEFQPTPTFNGQISATTLTVNSPASIAGLGIGSTISGSGVTANTIITGVGTGAGGVGTYTVNNSQSVSAETMTGGILFVQDNSGGSGLLFQGCEGIGSTMPFAPNVPSFHNWVGVYFSANDGVAEGPIPLGSRISTNSAGQSNISATGDVTVAQLTLAPGTYRLTGVLQTIISTGGGTATQVACQITTNSSATSPANSVSTLVEGAAQTSSFGGSQDARLSCYTVVQVFASTTYYLRAHFTLSGTISEAYNGQLRAELIQ